mgnify:CR=1 FL=1
MENEIRIHDEKKQVKVGKVWRPCCKFKGCTNRTEKGLCSIHNPETTHTIGVKCRIKQTPLNSFL